MPTSQARFFVIPAPDCSAGTHNRTLAWRQERVESGHQAVIAAATFLQS